MRSDALAMSVTQADGRVYRWGGDEPNAGDVPQGLTFGSSIPGGDKDLSCGLARRVDLEYADQALFDSVRVYGPGGESVWRGSQAQFPRHHGDQFSIGVGAVGLASQLRFDPSFHQVYVDRDPGSWGDMPLARKAAVAGGAIDFGSLSWATDGGLVAALPSSALAAQVIAETWYRAPGGLTITKVMYVGADTTMPAGWEAPALKSSATDDATGGVSDSATFNGALQSLTLAAGPRRYLFWRVWSNGTASTPAAGSSRRISKIATNGNHTVPTRANGTDPDGVYASDVIADIVARAAPGLAFTTGAAGSIQPTTFPIPHLAFPDPAAAAAETAILRTNAFHLWEWGVYDGTFFFRPPDSSSPGRPGPVTWETRLSSGAWFDPEGEQADDVYNGVVVTFTDVDGTRKSVGPPGAAVDTTDTSLVNTSATNPVNAHGIPRKWALLELSEPCTTAGAIVIGAVYLAEKALPQRRGTLVVTGTITHPTAGARPTWAVRAGDFVYVRDHPVDVARRIIETRYDHDKRQITLSLDNGVFKLDAILERMGVGLVGVQS